VESCGAARLGSSARLLRGGRTNSRTNN